jgi:hypothetical protein
MRAPAQPATDRAAYGAFDAGAHYGHEELWPGERIGPPLKRTRGKTVLGCALLVVVLGGGWALLGEQVTTWSNWQSAGAAMSAWASAWMNRSVAAPAEPATVALATAAPASRLEPPPMKAAAPYTLPPTPQPPAAGDAPPPPAPAAKAATPVTIAAVPPVIPGAEARAPGPLPPPVADPADPYQVRAAAVGLHPDLSRVLLARLSSTDYHNAAIAIRTALSETPDGAVFVYPRQRKPELALFQVRFVQGAAPGCRRYVVTVTKDRWLTTAPPMERCGAQHVRTGAK